jgi:hypothetical protein
MSALQEPRPRHREPSRGRQGLCIREMLELERNGPAEHVQYQFF